MESPGSNKMNWSPSSMHPEDETEKEGIKPGVNEDGLSEIEPFSSSLQDVSSLRITSLLTNISSISLKELHGQVAEGGGTGSVGTGSVGTALMHLLNSTLKEPPSNKEKKALMRQESLLGILLWQKRRNRYVIFFQ